MRARSSSVEVTENFIAVLALHRNMTALKILNLEELFTEKRKRQRIEDGENRRKVSKRK